MDDYHNLKKILEDPRANNIDSGNNYPIRSHAAKGPIFIHFPNKIYVSLDKKDSGYPNKKLAGKITSFGGNWNRIEQKTPEDVYVAELTEEWKLGDRHPLAEMIKDGRFEYRCFAEYFSVVPKEAHGNPKIDLYLNPVTFFVAHVQGNDLLDVLGVPRDGITKDKLHKAITAVTEFNSSELLDLDDLRAGKMSTGEPQFAWGDEFMLADVIQAEFGFDPKFVKTPGVEVYRLQNVKPNQPYSTRWTTKYDYSNPIRKGTTDDAKVFS